MTGMAKDDADRTELRFYARSVPHFYSYDYSDNEYVPNVSYGNYDPNNASNYINALTNVNRINNVLKENYTTRFDATYDADNLSIKAGLNYNNRKVTYSEGYGAAPSFNPSAYTMLFPISNFGSDLGGSGLLPFRVIDFDAISNAGIITPGQHIHKDHWTSMNGTARDGTKTGVFLAQDSRFSETGSFGPGARKNDIEIKWKKNIDIKKLYKDFFHEWNLGE